MYSKFLWRLSTIILTFSLLLGCESKPRWRHFQGGVHIVLEIESAGNPAIDQDNINRITTILSDRIEQLKIKKKIIKMKNKSQIIVQLPHCEDPNRIIDIISKSYKLEFLLIDDLHSLHHALKGNIPPGSEILYHLYKTELNEMTVQRSKVAYLVRTESKLTGKYITNVIARKDRYNQYYIVIEFDDTGARLLEQITRENIAKRLAIVINKKVYSVLIIRGKVSDGRVAIMGGFTLDEALNMVWYFTLNEIRDLAMVLRTGAYPVPIRISELKELTREIWLGNS